MLATPLCTIEKYADLVGVSVDVVRGWKAKGYLPTVSVGKYTLVNLIAVARLAEADTPTFAKPPRAVVPSPDVRRGRAAARGRFAGGEAGAKRTPDGNHGDNLSGESQEAVL